MFIVCNVLLNSILSFQVEFHPYWHEDNLVDFCKKHNITFNSYSPGGAPDHAVTLGSNWNPIPDLRKHPNVTAIAQKHSKTPAQVLYRWHVQQDVVINPRTRKPVHMVENLSIFDFQLDNQDMMTLSYLNHPISKVCGDPRLIL
jgi:diketogulonate reductase-like aldo/keto reductase